MKGPLVSKRARLVTAVLAVLLVPSLAFLIQEWPGYRDRHLLQAAANGDARKLRIWAFLGGNLYGPYYAGASPLMWGVRGDDGEVVKALLESGDDPNNEFNETTGGPIIVAVKTGDAELVKVLLEAGATKNLADDYGKTALDYAKSQHRTDLEELLTATVLPKTK